MSALATPTVAGAGYFTIVDGWRAQPADDAAAVAAFWMRESALHHDAIAQRLAQVVVHARTPSGDVAGVATAVATLPAWFGQPMYYFRAFVGRGWRATPLVRELTLRACAVLEADARARDFPCIGVLLELENHKFSVALRKPVWWKPRFTYVGRSERGLEMRAFYFEGARLKSPEEVATLILPAG